MEVKRFIRAVYVLFVVFKSHKLTAVIFLTAVTSRSTNMSVTFFFLHMHKIKKRDNERPLTNQCDNKL